MELHLRGLCLLILASPLALAQDPTPAAEDSGADRAAEIEALSPAVSSDELAAEREEIDPAMPSVVLAADVRRTTGTAGVMDELSLGRTEITGNQELPKVLYIVPWKKSDPGELMGKPVNTLLDEVLAPIDRSEFMRQVDYYGDLRKEEQD